MALIDFACYTGNALNKRRCEREESMQNEPPLKIYILAAEIVPFAKAGGMADVVGALPKALKALGHDVRLVMPRYSQVKPERFNLQPLLDAVPVKIGSYQEQIRVLQATIGEDIPVYFIDAPRYFERDNIYGYTDDGERFILFCQAALEAVRVLGWSPDVIHCHDWQTGIFPHWMHTLYHEDPLFAASAPVHTTHNPPTQAILPPLLLQPPHITSR